MTRSLSARHVPLERVRADRPAVLRLVTACQASTNYQHITGLTCLEEYY